MGRDNWMLFCKLLRSREVSEPISLLLPAQMIRNDSCLLYGIKVHR